MSRLIGVSLACAVTALGGGLWYFHAKPSVSRGNVALAGADPALRAELERLRSEVSNVSAAQRAQQWRSQLSERSPAVAAAAAVPSSKPKQPRLDPQAELAKRDRALHDAVARVGDKLDALLATDTVDAPWRADTTRDVSAAFADVPGKVIGTDCGSNLCRVVVEEPDAASMHDLPQKISQRPPFDSDVLFRYDMDANPPSVTLYVTRKGIAMASLVEDSSSDTSKELAE